MKLTDGSYNWKFLYWKETEAIGPAQKCHSDETLCHENVTRLCLQLRVKDINFQNKQIIVRNAKGDKDRVTLMF